MRNSDNGVCTNLDFFNEYVELQMRTDIQLLQPSAMLGFTIDQVWHREACERWYKVSIKNTQRNLECRGIFLVKQT